MELRLNTPIDTDTSAAGDPVSWTVVRAVRAPQSKEILVPAGAIVLGRVNSVEHHFVPSEYLVIGVAFESLEIDGESAPFAAKLNGDGAGASWVRPGAPTALQPRIPIGRLNTFSFPFTKRHVMAAGTVSFFWTVKRPPVREIR